MARPYRAMPHEPARPFRWPSEILKAELDRSIATGRHDETLARRQFAASPDEPDPRSAALARIASFVASFVIMAGPAFGSVAGLTMFLAGFFPAGWSVLVALIWTGAAAGWLTWLLRSRP